ncbi:hypothetical protein GCM10009122_24380 [Fulvivirga kasyanovii]|uniref:Uncharacterized protein n=1 Tax=Fulvivirga kasyanovii TaxID=396812 RepID=A0ABW9RSS2_9BACT|nr:hypothetical protein [Fulvivirga kasyanovii]MTI27218.1 hypothetical protein [Fulvivirga kasyanovii]
MTSRNNTRLIDEYLNGRLSPVDRLLFEARLTVDPTLKRDLYFQKKTYRLVKMYHREKLKEEIEALHKKIFSSADKLNFRSNIYQLFKSR